MMWLSLRAKRGSPGFGVSPSPDSRCFTTLAGTSIWYFFRIANASSQVVGSGNVGPLAIIPGSSPGISEISKVTTFAGAQASARRPPLMSERCFLTQFISEMLAPLLSNLRLICCFSSSVIFLAGKARRAEPPPEIRQITRSFSVRPLTISSIRLAASRPAASGTG